MSALNHRDQYNKSRLSNFSIRRAVIEGGFDSSISPSYSILIKSPVDKDLLV